VCFGYPLPLVRPASVKRCQVGEKPTPLTAAHIVVITSDVPIHEPSAKSIFKLLFLMNLNLLFCGFKSWHAGCI
jgi:hypothetical protein